MVSTLGLPITASSVCTAADLHASIAVNISECIIAWRPVYQEQTSGGLASGSLEILLCMVLGITLALVFNIPCQTILLNCEKNSKFRLSSTRLNLCIKCSTEDVTSPVYWM